MTAAADLFRQALRESQPATVLQFVRQTAPGDYRITLRYHHDNLSRGQADADAAKLTQNVLQFGWKIVRLEVTTVPRFAPSPPRQILDVVLRKTTTQAEAAETANEAKNGFAGGSPGWVNDLSTFSREARLSL